MSRPYSSCPARLGSSHTSHKAMLRGTLTHRFLSDMFPEDDFPHVDVFVVCYTEGPDIVEPTAIAAVNMNYPGEACQQLQSTLCSTSYAVPSGLSVLHAELIIAWLTCPQGMKCMPNHSPVSGTSKRSCKSGKSGTVHVRLAACAGAKLHVHVLDDGKNPGMASMVNKLSCQMRCAPN